MASPVAGDPLGEYRDELFRLCYRMLGSHHDAEDVLQEVSLRALRGLPDFEGRSSLRTWLRRIAVNACLDELGRRQRRVLPTDHIAASDGTEPIGDALTDVAWLTPTPTDPSLRAEERESVELAFVAAVQFLPPNQRAALILFEVLGYSADEIAETMATSTSSVNSALQRARATLAARRPAHTQHAALAALGDERQRDLVRRYTSAMQRHDLTALLALVTEDATWSMPPLPNWYRGHDAITRFLRKGPLTIEWRHRPTSANGQLAVGCYHATPAGFEAYALDVLELTAGGRIAGITGFLDPDLLAVFGLPRVVAD